MDYVQISIFDIFLRRADAYGTASLLIVKANIAMNDQVTGV